MEAGEERATRALRIGLIYRGKVVDEFIARAPRPLSVGTDPGATLSIDAVDLPPRLSLVDWRDDGYVLRAFPEMRGKIEVDGEIVELTDLGDRAATDDAGARLVSLAGASAGRVEIGEAVLVFQRAAVPPEPSPPELPRELRMDLASAIGGRLAGVLAATALLQIGFVVWTQLRDWPRPEERVLELETTGFVDAEQLSTERPEPPEDPPPARATPDRERNRPENDASQPKGSTDDPEGNEREEPRRSDDDSAPSSEERNLAASPPEEGTVLEALGSEGGEGLLAEMETASPTGEFDEAMAAGRHGTSDDREGMLETGGRAGDGGEGKTVGASDELGASPGARRAKRGIATDGARGARVDCPDCEEPDEGDGAPDSKVKGVGELLRRHAGRFRRCYERALKTNPDLSGKLVLSFRLDANGAPLAVHAARDTVGGGVASCVFAAVRRIDFPAPDGPSARVEKTFVFEPAR